MQAERIAVVGGGLVGLSCAWFLRAEGFEVGVLEAGAPGGGASRGNAGAICPSMVEPLPAPGMIRHALANAARADAALHVRVAFAPRMAGWLRRFRHAATEERFRAGLEALHPLAAGVTEAYDELARHGIGMHAEAEGYLLVHSSWRDAEEQRESIARAADLGLCSAPTDVLDGEEARAIEPILTDAVRAAVFLPDERWIDPSRLVDDLAAGLRAAGVEVREGAPVRSVRSTSAGVTVTTEGDDDVEADRAVIAAGVWTRDLTAPLGLSLPILPGKGYSFAVRPDPMPSHVMELADAHVMATPMSGRLRVAGTMEFDGTTDRFNPRRVEAIVHATSPFLHADLTTRDEEWVGPRPMTPDGLPVIGTVPDHERIVVAAGHNMLGVTLAPVTGRTLAALFAGQDDGVDLRPFAPGRFTH